MFKKILIANRGEIAVRGIRACRDLGIPAAALYSEADRGALHVRLADEAHPCGPAPARESYLDIDRVLGAAHAAGADAVFPGYGFLSENGEFSDRCAREGLCFIGPPGDVIRAMGDKVTSRRSAERAGVPIVPGATEALSDDDAARFARSIGFPVMVKASAGGGGRGLRTVREESELGQALERARSEATASFGDGAIYIEKVVENARHIEIQLLADGQGGVIHLFERECSIQRRHQKVIEEAPASGMKPELREQMGRAAVAMARAVGYVGAGTCEFLLDDAGAFYFLEMNTRIQVEHTITEEITGVDIARSMIEIAAGEPLRIDQSDLGIRGHAIEARIYAEDPDRRFLPSPGEISVYRPPGGPGVRVDSGVEAGSRVSVHYDPMIAKLVVWGAERPEAIARLERALAEFSVGGIRTSLPFHRRVVRHPVFREGRYDTSFIDSHMADVADPSRAKDSERVELQGVARLLAAVMRHRLDGDAAEAKRYAVSAPKGERIDFEVAKLAAGRYAVGTGGESVVVDVADATGAAVSVLVGATQYEAVVGAVKSNRFDVGVAGHGFRIDVSPSD